eukprot:10903468-Karenia_brevis.AAC.1
MDLEDARGLCELPNGNPEQAKHRFLKVLEFRKQQKPINHEDFGDVLANLGRAHDQLGQHGQASHYFKAYL